MVFMYLDAATGGMVIQTLVAAAVALPIVLRSQVSRGIARLRAFRSRGRQDPSAPST
jgi:hypothetical protein